MWMSCLKLQSDTELKTKAYEILGWKRLMRKSVKLLTTNKIEITIWKRIYCQKVNIRHGMKMRLKNAHNVTFVEI